MPNERTIDKAVQAFREAERNLQEFMASPEARPILEEYSMLIAEYNEKLDAAIRAMKSEAQKTDSDKLIVDGLGVQKRYKRWYDGDILAKSLPSDIADEVLTEKVVYEVDKERLEQLVRQGEVDNNIVKMAFKEEASITMMPGMPKPYVIPAVPRSGT